ncbi:MAG TPA: glycoside hydrolase family 16 protein [Asticcacaulis sp.]|nr:glycoside hydrolase family 16 protein [Asticcacaulis sp.]
MRKLSAPLLSRRSLLATLGAVTVPPALLAGCGGGSGSAGGVSPAPTGSVTITPTDGAAASSSASSSSSAASSSAAPYVPAMTWTKAIGPALNTSNLALTFDSTFSAPDALSHISASGGPGPWFGPVHASFGAATFVAPTHIPSPFSIVDGKLRIRCEQVNGAWQTGHMQTCDFSGAGFAQQRGYFEIRCKMPAQGTQGAWPAFWLYSRTFYTDPSKTKAEIDVIEYYPGNDARGHHSTVHLRPGNPVQPGEIAQAWQAACYNSILSMQDGAYHTYGAEITADWIIIYFDRVELKRIPMSHEFDTPLYLLVSMSLNPDEVAKAVGPIDLLVDYVRVWQRV